MVGKSQYRLPSDQDQVKNSRGYGNSEIQCMNGVAIGIGIKKWSTGQIKNLLPTQSSLY